MAGPSQAAPSCHFHTVVAGDTLIALAQQHLARAPDWRVLARVNQVGNPRRIPIGQRLCLPLHLLKPTPQPGVVLDVTGEVTRHPPGVGLASSSRVEAGDLVPPGTRLQTGAKGYVSVQLPDGSVLRIQADTDARLTQSQRYETTGAFSSMWEVLRGRVESLVAPAKDGQPRQRIQTPQATLGVRGTTFRVATDGTRTLGETLSGSVAVQSGRQQTLLQAGHGTVVDRSGAAPQPAMPLPAAPDISQLPALHERVVLRFTLPATPEARAWRVQVAQDAQFHRVKGEVMSDSPLLRMTDLPDGDYFLRARVANAQGLESADAIQPFRLNARPEAPIPLGPPHQGKIRGRTAQLSWAEHPDAVHYRLQLARDEGFVQLVQDLPRLQATQTTVDLPPGDYHWRVASTAVGPDHGPWGDTQTLRMREPPAQPPPPRLTDTHLHFDLPAEPGQRFEFQMARDLAFTQLIADIRSDTSDIVAPRPHDGGRLYVRYRAIDDDGFIGPYATPQTVTLPACVRSTDGLCVGAGGRYLTTQP